MTSYNLSFSLALTTLYNGAEKDTSPSLPSLYPTTSCKNPITASFYDCSFSYSKQMRENDSRCYYKSSKVWEEELSVIVLDDFSFSILMILWFYYCYLICDQKNHELCKKKCYSPPPPPFYNICMWFCAQSFTAVLYLQNFQKPLSYVWSTFLT